MGRLRRSFSSTLTTVWWLCLAWVWVADGFYVPGVAPTDFEKGAKIEIRAIKMTSTHTQLPYEYYSLELCPPKDGKLVYKSEVTVLTCTRFFRSPFAKIVLLF